MDIIKPQKGFQEKFCSSRADIVIGGGAAGCFVSDTTILMSNGKRKKISDVKIGDVVMSLNEKSGKLEEKKVLKCYRYGGRHDIITVFLRNGEKITATGSHEFYYRGDWIAIRDIAGRRMAEVGGVRQPIFSVKYGKGSYFDVEKLKNSKDIISSKRRIRISPNDVKDEVWEAREINLEEITRVEFYKYSGDVYDICVESNHNYIISKSNIIVHNSGKSFALLMEGARNMPNPEFGGIIFRRTTPQIRNEGGLWDESLKIYGKFGGDPKDSRLLWKFPSGATMKFSHLQYEKTKYEYQGSQIAYIGFDELTHFTKTQVFYLLGRNRSTCGVRPYIRATCNPDPESWVRELIDWWIGEDGFPIAERSGVIRYFAQDSGEYVWGDTIAEVAEKIPHIIAKLPATIKPEQIIKSITFIDGKVYDNQILLEDDPNYLGNLLSQEEDERARLLEGNWNLIQDNHALYNYAAINDVYSNYIKDSSERSITGDIAAEGRDLAVLIAWRGRGAVEIRVFTKSKVTGESEEGKPSLHVEVEDMRKKYNIPKSRCAFDEGGMGIGLVNEGYVGFVSNAAALPPPHNGNDMQKPARENYKNLKTQCYYRFARSVNNGEVWIDKDNIFVDGKKTRWVKIGKELLDVTELIKKDFRSVKRDKDSMDDAKKKIISKEEQKNILRGRSPDFGDGLSIIEFLDLINASEATDGNAVFFG